MSSAILKKLGVVAGILVLLWGVYLYRQVPQSQSPFAKADKLAEHIMLQQGPKKVDLAKQGNVWKVASGAGSFYPADSERVMTLLSGLKDLQVEDEISSRADRAEDYQLNAESATRVRLSDAKDSILAEGLFGKQAPDYAHIYFRFPDRPNVYLARGINRGEFGSADIHSWRSKQLIDIPETKIQAITIEGKGFKTELVRTSTDVWTLDGKAIEAGPINALVGTLAHLRADDFVDPAATPGLTFEELTQSRVTVKGSDVSVELRIGIQDTKSKRFPVSAGKEAGLAWVSEPTLKALLQKPAFFKAKSPA